MVTIEEMIGLFIAWSLVAAACAALAFIQVRYA